jgi:hypothetical protein
MLEKIREDQDKIMEFDEKGNPVGKYADNWTQWLGYEVRNHIHDIHKTWDEVDEKDKTDLWTRLQVIRNPLKRDIKLFIGLSTSLTLDFFLSFAA